MTLYRSPTTNFWSSTLNGSIDSSVQTTTLNSTTGLRAPGALIIDRQDSSQNNTPSAREVISYTGISGSDLTGVTRGFSSSTARTHSDGALIEAVMETGMWDNLVSTVTVAFDANGVFNSVISPMSVSSLNVVNMALSGVASVIKVQSDTYAGLKGQFVWTYPGALVTSIATVAGDTHLAVLRARKNLTINSVWAGVTSAPSLSFLECNLHYKSTPTSAFGAILTNFLYVDIGEPTSDSAATVSSLALSSLASGTLIYPSIAKPGGAGDLTLVMACTER